MALDVAVLWALVRRNLVTYIPIFSVYASFNLLRELGYFYVFHNGPPASVFFFYWSCVGIGCVFTFLLILAFWKHGLRQFPGIWRVSRWFFTLTLAGVFLVIAGTTRFGQGAAPQPGWWLSEWMRLMSRSIMFTQAVLLLAFFLILGYFRIQIISLVRGLVLSWFGYSLVSVALYSWRYAVGPRVQEAFSVANSLSSVMLLAAWSGVLWTYARDNVVEVAPVFAFRASPQQVIGQMEALNRSLMRVLKA